MLLPSLSSEIYAKSAVVAICSIGLGGEFLGNNRVYPVSNTVKARHSNLMI